MKEGAVHVYAPQPTECAVHATTCPDCGQRTRMLQFFVEWFGWDSTCLRCGRMWVDGEWAALPFMRGARQKNIDAAKARCRRLATTRT